MTAAEKAKLREALERIIGEDYSFPRGSGAFAKCDCRECSMARESLHNKRVADADKLRAHLDSLPTEATGTEAEAAWIHDEAQKDLERLVAMAIAYDPKDTDGYIASCEATIRAALRGPDAETRRRAWEAVELMRDGDLECDGTSLDQLADAVRAGLYPEDGGDA